MAPEVMRCEDYSEKVLTERERERGREAGRQTDRQTD